MNGICPLPPPAPPLTPPDRRPGTPGSEKEFPSNRNYNSIGAFAIDGDTIVAGSPYEYVGSDRFYNTGAAYVFVRSGNAWVRTVRLSASVVIGYFGDTVDIDGDTIVVGASSDYGGAIPGAFVFVRNGENWLQQAHLSASNLDDGDGFSYSVAVSGDTVIAGALVEASAATGINGDQDDNSSEQTGAAYVFTRDGTSWTQLAYVKASNAGQWDQFGISVAASGDRFVVGAGFEGAGSGAAYVFRATEIPPLLEQALGDGQLEVSADGSSVTVSYKRRRDREDIGVSYALEVSTHLQDWSPATGAESVTIVDATWEEVAVTLGVEEGARALFARVRVSEAR
jgi:hypothetical protein